MFSFVIPSVRDRREWLERGLSSLARETEGLDAEALVVVEDDDAARGLAELSTTSLTVRPVIRDGGAARRRNAAFAEVQGDVVVLLDDDADPMPGYGAALAERFADGKEHLVQGAVWPDFETEPPGEIGPVLFSVGGFNRVDDRRRDDVFISANCAFSRSLLDRVGPMREDLGPGSGGVPWGDDTEWHDRARQTGAVTEVDEKLAVRHRIQAERVTAQAVLDRAERVGRTRARLEWDDRRPGLWVYLRQSLLAVWAGTKAGHDIGGECLARRLRGYAAELSRIRNGLPPG